MVAKKIVFLVFLMVVIGAKAQTDPGIDRMIETEQYQKAKSALIAKLKTGTDISVWYQLGKVYLLTGNADSAKICFSRTVSPDPKNLLGAIGQAMVEHLSGNNSQALLSLDKTNKAATAAKDSKALIEIAEARFVSGDTITWLAPLTVASGLEKKNPKPFLLSGRLYLSLGEKFNQPSYFGLAAGRFEQALYVDPANQEAQNRLAALYMKVNNFRDAEEKLRKICDQDSTYYPALRNLGELEYTLGRYDLASKYFGQFIRNAEYTGKDLTRYVTILYFNKEYLTAFSLINQVLAKDPSNAVMLRLKGYTAYELNKNQEGLEAMTSFFNVRSTVDTAKIIASDYEYYGKLLAKAGSDSLAIISLKKAIEMDSTKTPLYEDLARCFEKQKNFQAAVNNLQYFIDSRKGGVSSLIYFSLGKDYLVLANDVNGTADSLKRPGYLSLADSAFGKVVSVSPNSYLGYFWRARVEAGIDPETTLGLAKPDYEKALSILDQKNDPQKYKQDLIEIYRYLGYYYYLQIETLKKSGSDAESLSAKTSSASYWQKVLDLDPANEIAKKAMNALNK